MSKSVKRLFEYFQPQSYALEIHPDAAAMEFHGTVTITGKKVGRPSQRLTFHQNGLKITSAQVIRHDKKGDQVIEISRINHQNTLHEVRLHSGSMLYGGMYTVTMTFEAKIERGLTGLYPCFFKHEGKEHTMLMTQFESHHAREAFPCIDEPEAKATFDLTLSHPTDQTALSNMPSRKTRKQEDGTSLTIFETSPVMSTYLLAFVIGEMHSKETTSAGGVAIRVWASLAQPAASFDFALDVARRSVEFFENYFGVPYPLPKLDHVAVPDFTSAAMENWGLITYRELALLLYPDAISQSTKELITLVICHETSHQWFGNLVTMKWWDDLWLNESFASVMEFRAMDELFPEWNIWNDFVANDGLSALRRDATPGVQAVKTEVHHPDEITTLFDPSIVYAKGGRLLYMLMHHIGEEAFRKGLTHYFKKHAYKNTRGVDLWQALSEASGIDVAAFMNPWLEQSGFPVLSVEQHDDVVRVSQEHFCEDRTKADEARQWPIPLFSNIPQLDFLNKKMAAGNIAKDTVAQIGIGGYGHYLVSYKADEHRAFITEQIKAQSISVADRLLLLNGSAMLAKAGYEPFANTLQLLEAYADESSDAVWDVMALIIADTRRFIDLAPEIEEPIKSMVASLVTEEYQRLGWQEKSDEPTTDKKLRATVIGLGAYAEVPEIINEAKRLFEAYKQDQSSVSAELQGIVFTVCIKHHVSDAFDYLLKLHNETTNSDLKRDIAGSLTATKDETEMRQILELLPQTDIIKSQDSNRWFVMLLRNRYAREITWQWMEDNWGWIKQTYSSDKSYDDFPRYAAIVCNTGEWLKRYRAFFEPKMDEVILRRNIAVGLEEISNRVTWLERDIAGVRNYLTK